MPYLLELFEYLAIDGGLLLKKKKKADGPYEWTPKTVDCGRVPVELLEMGDVARAEAQPDIASLAKTVANAMRAYKKSRRRPTKTAVTKAKTLTIDATPHPLFMKDDAVPDQGDSLRARIATYRPPQTIFEVSEATAGDKGAQTADRLRKRIIAKSALAQAKLVREQEEKEKQAKEAAEKEEADEAPPVVVGKDRKRRLSKAERRCQKLGLPPPARKKKKVHHEDPQPYMDNGVDPRHNELAMSKETVETPAAAKLEALLLDVAPDDAVDVAKKQKIYKWDARKKRYLQSTLGDMLDDKHRGNKKMKTESGTAVNAKDAARSAGDRYLKWQKDSKRNVIDFGDDDEIDPKKMKQRKGPGGAKSELRSAGEIAKRRLKADNLKLKNMPKAKRRSMTFGSSRDRDDSSRPRGRGRGNNIRGGRNQQHRR